MGEFWTVVLSGTVIAAVLETIRFFVNRHDKKKDDSDDVATEIAEVRKDVGKLADRFDEDRATNARIRILRFSDEVRHGVRHSKESFDQVNLDIDSYERYCREHKDYKNGRSVAAIANIKRVYANCLKDNDFLD